MSGTHTSVIDALSHKRIFIRMGTTDFRAGIDTLAAYATVTNREAFFAGAVFAYCAKNKKQIRLIFWEGCGIYMVTRKIQRAVFKWPKVTDQEDLEACHQQLKALMSDPVAWSSLQAARTVRALENKGKS